MNRIRTIRRLAWILAGLASVLLALSAVSPAAFARRLPPPRAGIRLAQAQGIAVNPRARTVYVSEFYPSASPMSVFSTTQH
jgi:hypothetical protein